MKVADRYYVSFHRIRAAFIRAERIADISGFAVAYTEFRKETWDVFGGLPTTTETEDIIAQKDVVIAQLIRERDMALTERDSHERWYLREREDLYWCRGRFNRVWSALTDIRSRVDLELEALADEATEGQGDWPSLRTAEPERVPFHGAGESGDS